MASVGIRKARVLIVDDEEMVRRALSGALEVLGHEVTVCEGGEQAVQCYAEIWQSVDLVIFDLMMPGLAGRRLLEALRRINPAVRSIVTSGHSIDGPASEVIEAGASGFLQKPYDLETLETLLSESLAG